MKLLQRFILACLCLLCPALSVMGDGKVFSRAVALPVETPDQRALLYFSNGVERLVIETSVAGRGTDFAWVVPLPSEPKIEIVSTNFFPNLERTFQPLVKHTFASFWMGILAVCFVVGVTLWVARYRRSALAKWLFALLMAFFVASVSLPALSSAGIKASRTIVELLQRENIGIYETAVLRGKNGAAVIEWLNKNGFSLPERASAVISDYAKRGWVFAAAKLNSNSDSAQRNLQPLAFTFRTERPVYPLRLTGIENGSCAIDLFVFGPGLANAKNFKATFCGRPTDVRSELSSLRESYRAFSYAQPGEFRLATAELVRFATPAECVTKLRATLTPSQMQEDAWIKWTEMRTIYPTVYSWKGAWGSALNLFMSIAGPGSLLALFFWPKFKKGRGYIFLGIVIILPAVVALVHLATATIVPVKIARFSGASRASFNNFQYMLQLVLQERPNTTSISFKQIEETFKSEGWPTAENVFTGEPLREERTPGNIAIEVFTNGVSTIYWHDINGAPHAIGEITSARER